MSAPRVEDVWRHEAPHVLGALLRRHGDYGDCEDAAQEALVAALQQWPREGTPDNPRGWLVRVASRRLVDRQRARTTRERRELIDAVARLDDAQPAVDSRAAATDRDESLRLLLMCCHESLSRPSQVALTLRASPGCRWRRSPPRTSSRLAP